MAIIHLENLHARAMIGIKPMERRNPQELIIDCHIEYDSRKAVKTDDVRYALDYAKLSTEIIQRAERSRFFLLEKLAADLVALIIGKTLVRQASVRIEKPKALGGGKKVAVEMSAVAKRAKRVPA
jgi:FolB domain-containing protein